MTFRFSPRAASTIAAAALPWLQWPNLRSKTAETFTAAVTAENRSKMMNCLLLLLIGYFILYVGLNEIEKTT